MIFFDDKIKREIIFVKIQLDQKVKNFDMEIKCEGNNKLVKIKFDDISNFILIDLKPINVLIKEKIFFGMKPEEKTILFEKIVSYFEKNDYAEMKIKFLEAILKEKIFQPFKFGDVFILVKIFKGIFLNENFKIVFKNINKFTLNFNDKETLNSIKSQVLKLYNELLNSKDLNSICVEIWPFIFLLLVKYKEKEKVIRLLSLIESIEHKIIVGSLLKKIKELLMNQQPFDEIKDYFIYLIKFSDDLNFYIDYIDNYEEYINIIETNIEYIKNNISIFPNNKLNETIKPNSKKILSSIIQIIEKKGDKIIMDSGKIKKYFNDYLKILKHDEKEIY